MKKTPVSNRYTLQMEMDILTAILAHELGNMSFMKTDISKGERQLYKAVEHIVLERIPDDIQDAMIRNHAYERAHLMLLQLGFGAWELIGLQENDKRICRS